MRRSDDNSVVQVSYWGCGFLFGAAIVFLLTSCTGYFAPGGAALYCKDRHGKAIRCPEERSDSTKADTTHTER